MNNSMRWLSLSLITFAMVTQFNNCGTYSDAPGTVSASSSVNCLDDTCINSSIDSISLKVNYGGATEFSVTPDQAEFNLGGDCNEGGFPFNTIRWELHLNGVMVRHSGLLSVDSRCINGRFLVYINLSAIAGADPVDRTGLKTSNPAIRSPYDLWIEVYGQNVPGGTAQRNNLKGKTRISLIAI